ncbi:hypothetical protein JL720_707 [Aureococcus anophagefferens]|nr:hypothetical protein JL720_707 [Aureococcus anophagefferens]
MLRRKTKPEAPPNQDAESPPEPQTAPKPDATPKEEPWWAVTTPRNEARLFFAVYFAWQSATLLAKMRDMRVFLDMGYLPKGGRFCWHAPVALTPATHGYAVLLLAAALLALAAAVARAAPAPATRCLALGAYAAARVAFPPVERMASIEKKANMDALTGAWGAPTAAWPLTVYRVVIYVAYFNAGVSKLVAASPAPSSAEFAATSHGAARWLPGLSALVLRGARRVSLDFSDGGTLRGPSRRIWRCDRRFEGVARQLVDAPAACALLSFGSLAFELLGWTLALRPREAHRLLAAGVGAVGFHLGIFLLMRINACVVAALAAAPDAPDAGAGDDGDDAPSAASFNAAREAMARRYDFRAASAPTVADDRILQLDRNGTNRWTLRFAGCGATSIPVATWRDRAGVGAASRRRTVGARRRGARGLPGRAPREARGRRRPHRRGQGLAPGGVERTQAVDGPR